MLGRAPVPVPGLSAAGGAMGAAAGVIVMAVRWRVPNPLLLLLALGATSVLDRWLLSESARTVVEAVPIAEEVAREGAEGREERDAWLRERERERDEALLAVDVLRVWGIVGDGGPACRDAGRWCGAER